MNEEKQTQTLAGNVRVVVRFRPLNERQRIMGLSITHQLYDNKNIVVKQYRSDKPDKPQVHSFSFDRTFDMYSTQQEIYSYAAQPVIDSVLQGFNGTVFAYGQTASGKTYTMEGSSIEGDVNAGIIPRMVRHVFKAIANSPDNVEFRIKVSMVQLYMEKLRDLLDVSKSDLKIRSDKKKGIFIEDLTENYISEPEEIFDMLKIAQVNRAICATNMNERSSRSHMILIMSISQNHLQDLSAKTGKLYLVDLAGSEKVGKTGAEGKLLDEAKKINLSLATLGKVISALTDGKSTHIPYRDSKLTRALQESLGGNSKTTLIVTCSPHICNLSETLSALRFGMSAKNIKNKPKINREYTVAELQILLEKAEAKIVEKQKHMKRVEEFIKSEFKIKIPVQIQETPPGECDEDKLKSLQNQLEIQRNNNSIQADRINVLNMQISDMDSRIEELQREKSFLLEKMTKLQIIAYSNSKDRPQYGSLNNLLTKVYDSTLDINTKNLLEPILQPSNLETNSIFNEVRLLPGTNIPGLQNYQIDKQRKENLQDQSIRNQKDLKKKILSLQNNIQQLTANYYDLFVQQSKWKVENAMNLRRIDKKNLLIESMENTINDLRYQLQKKQLSDEDQDSDVDVTKIIRSREIKALKQFAHSKLIKPVRGGKPKP